MRFIIDWVVSSSISRVPSETYLECEEVRNKRIKLKHTTKTLVKESAK